MFTKTALILALVDLAAAAPAVTNKLTSPVPNTNRYTAIASHSGSPIQNLGIAANGRNFYINKGTSSYCPSPPIDCSNYENNHNQAFIRTDGSLGFNGPHSISVPEGAVYCPFQYALKRKKV
ncbi:hypothetical protein DL95DRAFT_456964 [Leptodontidium sp. 2 PMI_412]|nr:hypothetical protein DL95DRAFT_456964 [Leptodontidium sp. 2 PMI_412]